MVGVEHGPLSGPTLSWVEHVEHVVENDEKLQFGDVPV